MLHTKGPVPHVGRCQITVHGHDGAGTVETVNGGAAIERAVVPGNVGRVQEERQRDVASGDRAARGIASGINGRAGRNAARTKGIVEGDERLPVHRFINQIHRRRELQLRLCRSYPRRIRGAGRSSCDQDCTDWRSDWCPFLPVLSPGSDQNSRAGCALPVEPS